jgi:ribulose-phosphate 3-epimerase
VARLAASVLGADPLRLADAVREADERSIPILHIDAMDGNFAPNIAFGPDTVRAMRPLFRGYFDVHLMLLHPEQYLERYAEAGADGLTIHVEVTTHHHRRLAEIRRLGCRTGLAVNPGTPLEAALELLRLEAVDTLLIMSVNPGFSGASFIEALLRKVEQARSWRDQHGWTYDIAIDGGMDVGNVRAVVYAGVDVVVAGRGLYGGPSLAARADALERAIAGATDAAV